MPLSTYHWTTTVSWYHTLFVGIVVDIIIIMVIRRYIIIRVWVNWPAVRWRAHTCAVYWLPATTTRRSRALSRYRPLNNRRESIKRENPKATAITKPQCLAPCRRHPSRPSAAQVATNFGSSLASPPYDSWKKKLQEQNIFSRFVEHVFIRKNSPRKIVIYFPHFRKFLRFFQLLSRLIRFSVTLPRIIRIYPYQRKHVVYSH